MDRPRRAYREAVLKPKPPTIPRREYSPWAPLSDILDRLEDEGLLFCDPDRSLRSGREVLVDFLAWCLKDGVQIGTDACTGEVMVRAPYRN